MRFKFYKMYFIVTGLSNKSQKIIFRMIECNNLFGGQNVTEGQISTLMIHKLVYLIWLDGVVKIADKFLICNKPKGDTGQ